MEEINGHRDALSHIDDRLSRLLKSSGLNALAILESEAIKDSYLIDWLRFQLEYIRDTARLFSQMEE